MERGDAGVTPELVWLNGQFVAEAEARIPLAAHGVLCGDGIFETLRVYAGAPFRLDRHLTRLAESAAVVGLEIRFPTAELTSAVEELLRRRALREAAVRVTVLRG